MLFIFSSFISLQSLGILASIPAAILIISLVGLLLYLLTRCCDRKSRKVQSQACQKFTLISITLFCCAGIGLGKFLILFFFSLSTFKLQLWMNEMDRRAFCSSDWNRKRFSVIVGSINDFLYFPLFRFVHVLWDLEHVSKSD